MLRLSFFIDKPMGIYLKTAFVLLLTAVASTAVFSQNSLDYYISKALDNSPLLKDYQNQVQSGLIDSQLIRASYRPQVTGSSVNTYAPVISGWGYDNAITNGGNVVALVGVNKALVSRKNLNTQYRAVQLQNQSIQNTARISEQDLKRTVTTQYITTYGDMQQLNFNKEINSLLTREEVILKRLAERNVYRQTDYLTFLVTLQQQQLAVKQLQIQFQNDYATLNYLCGITDTTVVTLNDPQLFLASLPGIDQSVFFRQFSIDSLKLSNSKDLVNFNYRPKINLYADGGYNSSFAYQAYKNFGTSFGINISVPIYDGHQRKMQYNKIAIAERTRSNYKDFFTKQYNQQVAQLMQQLKGTEMLLDQINKQIKYSESLITANGKLLETGDARIADYVIALNTYMNAKNLLTQNNVSRLQIINQINYWNR